MRHAPSTLHFSHAFRPAGWPGAIEWEELPSLAARVRARDATFASSPAWDATRPAALEAPTVPMPFREPLQGVVMREVNEPDLFRHFFGS